MKQRQNRKEEERKTQRKLTMTPKRNKGKLNNALQINVQYHINHNLFRIDEVHCTQKVFNPNFVALMKFWF